MNLESNIIEKLISLAHTAPSADNAQPWHFIWDGEYLRIKYDSQRVTGKTFPANSPATLLSMGTVIEIIMGAASQWKLDAALELNEYLPDEHGEYAKIRIRQGNSTTRDDSLTHPSPLAALFLLKRKLLPSHSCTSCILNRTFDASFTRSAASRICFRSVNNISLALPSLSSSCAA
jgi:hypothetical protein